MDAVLLERQYLRTTKFFLHLAGVWPDQNKISKYTVRAFTYTVMISGFVVEMARIVHIPSMDVIVEQSPFICAIFVLFLKQGNYIINGTKLKSLLNGMYEDWVVHRSEEEVTIMSKYIARGTFLTMFYLVNAYVCCFLFLQVPWTTRLLEMFKSGNTTPTAVYVVPAYYFTEDEYKYYYFIQIHMSMTIIVTVIVFVACDTSYTILVHHACGLMDIAGYRFKHAIKHLSFDTKNSEKLVKETYRRIFLSIEAHQRAIAYLHEVDDAHVIYLFICIGLIISCFTITLVKVVTMQICIDFYKYCSFLVVQLMHLFYLMIQGQFVTNTTDEIYNTILSTILTPCVRLTEMHVGYRVIRSTMVREQHKIANIIRISIAKKPNASTIDSWRLNKSELTKFHGGVKIIRLILHSVKISMNSKKMSREYVAIS